MEPDELDIVFANVAPYLFDLSRIRGFLEKHGHLEREKLIKKLKKRIEKKEGVPRTDYKILLNKLEEQR